MLEVLPMQIYFLSIAIFVKLLISLRYFGYKVIQHVSSTSLFLLFNLIFYFICSLNKYSVGFINILSARILASCLTRSIISIFKNEVWCLSIHSALKYLLIFCHCRITVG